MTAATLPNGMRQVLDAPRGQRFTRPIAPRTHQARMLDRMADNPRVRYRKLHGELPAWMNTRAGRTPPGTQRAPQAPPIPRPHISRPPVPISPRRPGSHRKPRHRTGWILAGHALAATTGAFVYHLFGFLS